MVTFLVGLISFAVLINVLLSQVNKLINQIFTLYVLIFNSKKIIYFRTKNITEHKIIKKE